MNLLAWELKKLLSWRAARLALIAQVLVVLLGLAVFALARPGSPQQEGQPLPQLRNGLTFARNILGPTVALLAPLFLMAAAAESLAGEQGRGTLKAVLSRPVSRSKVFLAKAGACVVFLCAFMWGTGLLAGGAGTLALGTGGMRPMKWTSDSLEPVEVETEGGVVRGFRVPEIGSKEGLVRLGLAYAVSPVLLLPIAALGLLVSALASRASTALAAGLGAYFGLHVLSLLAGASPLRRVLLVGYFKSWEAAFYQRPAWKELAWALVATAIISLVIGTGACLVFKGKKLAAPAEAEG